MRNEETISSNLQAQPFPPFTHEVHLYYPLPFLPTHSQSTINHPAPPDNYREPSPLARVESHPTLAHYCQKNKIGILFYMPATNLQPYY